MEFGPAAGVKGGVAEGVEEVCASFRVWVGDLYFRWEEGSEVSVELGGILDFDSEVRCAQLYEVRGDVCPGGQG